MIKSMNIFKKASPVNGTLFVKNLFTKSMGNKKEFAQEGHNLNVIVYRAVKEITTAIASIRLAVKQNEDVLDDHLALQLLKQPNPTQGFDSFMRNLFTDYLVFGEMFIAKVGPENGPPKELWSLNPLDMSVKPGMGGMPSAYIFGEKTEHEKMFPVNQITGESEIFFHKLYNPLDKWRGLSPLGPAGLSADIHNSGLRWNFSLLKNSGRPSGMVQFTGSPSSETLARVREFFVKKVQGERNAGEVPVLTNGAKWEAMDNTPRDMDFNNTIKEMAKYIASALGVPLPLIENDAATFNNMVQAKERFWTDTVLPLMEEFLSELSKWLLTAYGEKLEFSIDTDSIPALEEVRKKRYERMAKAVNAGIITINEARKELGFKEIEGEADSLFIPSSLIPLEMANEELPEDLDFDAEKPLENEEESD